MLAKRAIQGATVALLASTGLVGIASADTHPRYDRRIEEAAIRMLQPKLGEIRGPLGLTLEGHIFPPLRQRLIESGEASWPAALPPGRGEGSIIRY